MAPKRKNDSEAANPQPAKRNKAQSHAPSALDGDEEVGNADALRRSMQQKPRKVSILTLNPRRFDEEEEIRKADAMRLAMQTGPRYTPAPIGNSAPLNIKQEHEDSEIDEPLAYPADIPGLDTGARTASFSHGSYLDLPLPASDATIEAEIETTALFLSRCDRMHPLYQPAIENLRRVCFSTHDMQVRSVVDRLVGHGVPNIKADEVAAMFRQKSPLSVPLGEVAASLRNFEQLEIVLGALQEAVPSQGVSDQLISWRNDIHNRPIADREFGNLISTESRGGSVFMSGGLGATVDASQPGDDTLVKQEPGSDMEVTGDFIQDGGAALLHAPGSATDEMHIRFPDRRSIFLFHVFKASQAANIRLSQSACDQQALGFWEKFDREQKRNWTRLKKKLWKGDTAILETSAAKSLLAEHGLPDAITTATDDEAGSDNSMLSITAERDCGIGLANDGGVDLENEESDPADDGEEADTPGSNDSDKGSQASYDGRYAPLDEGRHTYPRRLKGSDVLQLNLTNKTKSKMVTKSCLVLYNPEHVSDSTIAFVVRTPGCPAREINNTDFTKICIAQLGESFKALSGITKNRTFAVLLHSPALAQQALFQHRCLRFEGHRVYAEPLPGKVTQLLFCDLSDVDFQEPQLAVAFKGLLNSSKEKRGQVQLLRYPAGQYLIHFYKPMPILKAYVKILGTKKTVRFACFRPVDTTLRNCPVCSGEHMWPCPQAQAVPMPSLPPKRAGGKRW